MHLSTVRPSPLVPVLIIPHASSSSPLSLKFLSLTLLSVNFFPCPALCQRGVEDEWCRRLSLWEGRPSGTESHVRPLPDSQRTTIQRQHHFSPRQTINRQHKHTPSQPRFSHTSMKTVLIRVKESEKNHTSAGNTIHSHIIAGGQSITLQLKFIKQRLIHITEHKCWHVIKYMSEIMIGKSKNIMAQWYIGLSSGLTHISLLNTVFKSIMAYSVEFNVTNNIYISQYMSCL